MNTDLVSLLDARALSELGLRLLGAFYMFAGVVAVRATTMDRFLDQALAGISMEPMSKAEQWRGIWLLAASIFIGASGLALIMLLDVALWLFVVSALGQAAFLFYVAPRFFDVIDPPDLRGRQVSINAFVVYCVVTALVGLAAVTGTLKSWEALPLWLPEGAVLVFMLWAGIGVAKYLAPLTKSKNSFDGSSDHDDASGSAPFDILTHYAVPDSVLLAPVWHGVPVLDRYTLEPVPAEYWGKKADQTLLSDVSAWQHQFRSGELLEVEGHARLKDADEQSAWEAEGRVLAERIKGALNVKTVEFVPRVQPWPPIALPDAVRVMPEQYCWPIWTLGSNGGETICPEQLGITGLLARDFADFGNAYDDGYFDRTYTAEDGRPDLMNLEKKAVHTLATRLKEALSALDRGEIAVYAWESGHGNVAPRTGEAI